MDDIERLAVEIKKLRLCEAGDVPCPFCRFNNDPDTIEMGCVWMAERLLESGVVTSTTPPK